MIDLIPAPAVPCYLHCGFIKADNRGGTPTLTVVVDHRRISDDGLERQDAATIAIAYNPADPDQAAAYAALDRIARRALRGDL